MNFKEFIDKNDLSECNCDEFVEHFFNDLKSNIPFEYRDDDSDTVTIEEYTIHKIDYENFPYTWESVIEMHNIIRKFSSYLLGMQRALERIEKDNSKITSIISRYSYCYTLYMKHDSDTNLICITLVVGFDKFPDNVEDLDSMIMINVLLSSIPLYKRHFLENVCGFCFALDGQKHNKLFNLLCLKEICPKCLEEIEYCDFHCPYFCIQSFHEHERIPFKFSP